MQTTRVFIGDVHGCADELDELLEKLRYDPTLHDLYFVGDLANRGPRPLKALRTAWQLAANVVLGNHDIHLLACAAGIRKARKSDTFRKILRAEDVGFLLGWLRSRPLAIEWDDIVLVHAGIPPAGVASLRRDLLAGGRLDLRSDPLEHPDVRFLTSVRYCDREGEMAPRARASRAARRSGKGRAGPIAAPWAPWDQWYSDDRIAVFGHWAARGRVRRKRLRGLDTGCVWGGRLTAWIAEEDRFISVRAHHQYLDP